VIVHYEPNIELRQALKSYFEKNEFGADGGYNDVWVDFKLGPIPFPFRNTKSRVRAVRYHDLHHILTGYDTDFRGELEIAGWELGAGCKDFAAAWGLNLGALAGGLLRAPVRTFRAFIRGRHAQTVYGDAYEELLSLTVADARRRCGTDREPPGATFNDTLLFSFYGALGLVVGLTLFAIGLLLLPFGLIASLTRPPKAKLNAS
jgi:hypothetical protein